MRRISLAVSLLLLLMLACDTANNIDPVFEQYFIKYYGSDGNQNGVDLLVLDDGAMVLLGNTSTQTDPNQPFIVKTDKEGNVLWQRHMGSADETAVDVEYINQGTLAGSLVVVSNTKNSGDTPHASGSIRLTVVDQSGHGVDSVVVVGPGWSAAKSVTIGSDDTFLVSGYCQPVDAANSDPVTPDIDKADIILLRIKQSLDIPVGQDPEVWHQGGETVGLAARTFEVNLAGTIKYAMFGYSDRPKNQGDQGDLAKYEKNFEVLIVNRDGVPGDRVVSGNDGDGEEASAAIHTPARSVDGASIDESYLMVGSSTNGGGTLTDIYVSRFTRNASGASLVQQGLATKLTHNGRYQGISVANATGSGYVVLGNEIDDGNSRDIFLMRIEQDGTERWSATFGAGDGDDSAGAVTVLPDGRIALLGTMELETQRKMTLIIVTDGGQFSQ